MCNTWGMNFYKPVLFFVSLFGALFFTYRELNFYTQMVKHIDEKFTKSVQATTTIQVDSDVTKSLTKFVFFAKDVDTGERYKVTTPATTDISFGDCFSVFGTFGPPEIKKINPQDETLPLYNFPYRQYLAKDDVYLLLNAKKLVKKLDCSDLSRYEKLEVFFMKQKEKLTKIFLMRYEQPYAGLAAGVLVAGKGLLDKDSLDMFKRTSLSHTVVLSGSNISIILVCIKLFVDFLFFWKKEKGWIIKLTQKIIILAVVWLFMLLVGGGAPIYRAVAGAYCGMILFQEKTSQVYALTVTILILTTISPFQTLYDPSFHLTCCATYGLILFSKPIDMYMKFLFLRTIPNWLREIISVTLATQVFVFPYIMFMTSSFSSVFLVSNILVLPLLPIVMLFGFMTLCADLLGIQVLVSLSVYVNNLFLHAIFYIVRILADVPYGYIVVTKTTSLIVLVVYSLLLSSVVNLSLRGSCKSSFNNTPV